MSENTEVTIAKLQSKIEYMLLRQAEYEAKIAMLEAKQTDIDGRLKTGKGVVIGILFIVGSGGVAVANWVSKMMGVTT